VTSLRRFALLAVVPVLALSAGCGSDDSTKTPKAEKAECSYSKGDTPAAKKVDSPSGTPGKDEPTDLTIATDQGDVPVSLDADKTPCAVHSFVSLAKQGYFDKTPCHRLTVEGIFVLQCGDPTGKGTGGPGYQFDDELVEKDARLQPCLGQVDPTSGKEVCTYTAGTLAMANGGPGTNGSQFFLVWKDSPLPAAYTAFGRMSAAGLKVVQKVAAAGAKAPDQTGNTAPKQPVQITSVK
jgi:peptidyl-prolyl cis-trans isomerase B (cyclophilin B)